ncbi:hypothetical protein ElyMa_003884300 [Elysia marginata]|uniref:ShKT domain-containing protein n=1 Tax=Elysia marginata TaxID=1093978 RepID=A0AAV4FLR2_9GAST|nr:hypothetical protein ElyMa_003884300 [Elysia marginata]
MIKKVLLFKYFSWNREDTLISQRFLCTHYNFPFPLTSPPATSVDTSSVPVTVMGGMDTSSAAPAATTMAAMQGGSPTAPVCSDHLNGMDCSALPNVCGSVMALSVCPKYCGLC